MPIHPAASTAAAAATPARVPVEGGKTPGAARVSDIRNVARDVAVPTAMQREHVASAATPAAGGMDRDTAPDKIFSKEGVLKQDAIDWVDAAGIKPARATSDPCVLVACGVFAYLNTGQKALASPYFDEVLTHGMQGTSASMLPGDALERLKQSGLDVRGDLFLQRDPGGIVANQQSLARHSKSVTTHVFDGNETGLRGAIRDIRIGETAILFINNWHAVALTRDRAGWHVFDTALNPHMDVHPDATGRAGRVTLDGNNHVHGYEAARLIAHYVNGVRTQPVLLRAPRATRSAPPDPAPAIAEIARADAHAALAESPRVPLPDHLSRESRTLDTLRRIAQSLVAPPSQADAQAIARELLAPALVAGLVEMHDGSQVRGYQASGDPSRREALKRQNALRKSVDVGYLQLLHALIQSAALPAAEVWEALRATPRGGQLAPYLLSSASEASLDLRHAHALAALLRQLAERMTGGSLELRTTLLEMSSSAGLRSGDKYRDFYGRLFRDGSKEALTSASIVAGKQLADADLIPTRAEIETTISPARAKKYLKAAQRAAKDYLRLSDDVRAEPSHASLQVIARNLVRRLDPATLQRGLALEAAAFGNYERKERRMVANGRVEAMVRDIVQEQWSRAMAEASRDLQPGLFAWVLAPDTALSYAEAARALPNQAPEQLVRMIFEEVVAKPEMQAYIEQLVEGGNPGEGETLVEALPDLGHAVESERRPLVDRVRAKAQAAADGAAKEKADRAAADAARDAADHAASRSRREAEAQARREADRVAAAVAADAGRDAADAARVRAESLAREQAHAAAEVQAARVAIAEETQRAFDRQMQRLERVHPGNVASMTDADLEMRFDALRADAESDVSRERVGVGLRAAEYLDERGQPRTKWL